MQLVIVDLISLQGWERGSHGTGMGHTTNKGFWIPEKPPTPPPQELLALPEPPRCGRASTGRPTKKHSKPPAGPKPPRGLGRPPKEIKQETDQESQVEDEPPEVCVACLLCSCFPSHKTLLLLPKPLVVDH